MASIVLTVLGGFVGLAGVAAGFRLLGLAALVGQDVAVDHPGARLVTAFAMAVTAIVAGAVIASKPEDSTGQAVRWWGVVLIVAAILGSLAVGRLFILGGVLILVAGILLLILRPRAASAT